MARPRTSIGTFGAFTFQTIRTGLVVARTRHRDDDGRRLIQASGATAKAAERNLMEKLTRRAGRFAGVGEITADSPFPTLVELWLEDLDLEGRIAATTRDLYEWNMRNLVLPTFEHFTLREISVSRVDRFLKAHAKVSYSRAKQSKTVLSLALGLAVRYEAIQRNPLLSPELRRRVARKRALTCGNAIHCAESVARNHRDGRELLSN